MKQRGYNIKSWVLLILLLIFLVPVFASSATIYVPADYPTIQSAINASTDGDEIVVSPGTYVENIHFDGKNIILRSTDPTSPQSLPALSLTAITPALWSLSPAPSLPPAPSPASPSPMVILLTMVEESTVAGGIIILLRL